MKTVNGWWRVALLCALLCALAGCGDSEGSSGPVIDADDEVDAGDVDADDAGGDDVSVEDEPEDDGPRPYPEPGAWPANAGPGGPTVTFEDEALFENCAFITGGELDRTQHHNILVMYDGYLLMPWAPEYGQGGLSFYDFSDPCEPQMVGTGWSRTMRETHAIGFSSIGGRWAVVNQIETLAVGGIQFWDVSDPTAPEAVADLPLEDFFYPDAYARVVLSVFWQAPYVYVAHADLGVVIVDAEDPRNPEVVNRYTFEPVLRAGQIHAIGNILIVTAAEGPRVALLDISDPAKPRPIAGGDFLVKNADGEPVEAYFSNTGAGYTYHAMKEGGGGIIVYDISDPSSPRRAGALRSEGNGGYVAVKDDLAFVGESTFATLYDLRDLDNVTELGRFDLKGDLDTITPIGNVAVLSVDDKAAFGEGSAVAPYRKEPDREAPRVTWVWPPDGASDLAATSRFGVTFNEMVDVKSAWEGSVRLYDTALGPLEGRVDGHISVQENVVNFWPREPLSFERQYTLELPAGGVVDYNGNPIEEPFIATFTTAAGAFVEADAGPSVSGLVGEALTLSGAASIGAVAYAWDPGDGRGQGAFSGTPEVSVTYDAPGRYRAVLTVRGESGEESVDEAVVTITAPPVFRPRSSGTVSFNDDGDKVAAVVPDAGTVVVAEVSNGSFGERHSASACDDPRNVAWIDGERLAVTCQRDDVLAIVDVEALMAEGDDPEAAVTRLSMPYGAAPYGVIAVDGVLWVTWQGRGELAQVTRTEQGFAVARRWSLTPDARGVALLPDGRLAVTRWRSTLSGGEVVVLTPETGATTRWVLPFADVPSDSDTETGGVPTWLDQIALSPDGAIAAIPALQANVAIGSFLSGTDLSHETTVRAVVAYLDPATGQPVRARKQFDDRGFAAAATFNAAGDFLYVVARGSRAVERLDRFNGAQAGTLLEAGWAPSGVAASPDGRWLVVDAALSRELRLIDVVSDSLPTQVAALPTVAEEPLSPEALRGAQLFNDAFDQRLAQDSYIACAHCHLEGDADNLTWDFTGRGEGLRNTISLRGRAGMGDGPLHWSANFDELQDFEHDLRGPFSGTGLMDDADYNAEGRDEPLGAPKAGLSAELDALAAYMTSLNWTPRSPHRADDGSLTESAQRGQALFESEELGCTGCHSGARLTDSAFIEPGVPRLHDVGTLRESSGQRLGAALTGIDTPSLRGLWANPPYLHDGSAETVRDVLTVAAPGSVHDVRGELESAQLDDLIAYMLSLDGQ